MSSTNKSVPIFKDMKLKVAITFGVFCLLFVGVGFATFYIGYSSGDKYEKIVLSQLDYDSRTIPFRRGDITDSKGTLLATSVDVYNLVLDCVVL